MTPRISRGGKTEQIYITPALGVRLETLTFEEGNVARTHVSDDSLEVRNHRPKPLVQLGFYID